MSDKGLSFRPIANLELDRFERPEIPGAPGFARRAAWYLVNAMFFQGAVLGLVPGGLKCALLRGFGARVGRGITIKPRVSIKSPWFLEIGDHSWIGECAWIDNHTAVRIGSNVCISQGVYIFTGNHDWSDPKFAFFCKPVEIGDGVWVTAFQRIPPGTVVPPNVAVLTAATTTSNEP
ncbi:putative colanic acid biosynthesis acetyltransferase [Limibaculum sp. M0105]|uniref:Putative colanic acid biosynthesis acetyltransferase n=1 Tax=Thermohalobaculum xanthum TaxID=2753746 RepID=A0A8J7M3Z3_9RHOB|nr:putative colanic acid biosynthesis acetyltransferase [Thermohalobaculum xanthum]MBK0397900.1 putative colanic acid biosynthesis acetyltransferase [Thermohalobaculum xanthum]